jgi:hypothetical protein
MALVKCIKENDTGRNILFQNVGNHEIMNRSEFVSRIKNPTSSYHDNYVVKIINGIETPVSKPDRCIKNNLE